MKDPTRVLHKEEASCHLQPEQIALLAMLRSWHASAALPFLSNGSRIGDQIPVQYAVARNKGKRLFPHIAKKIMNGFHIILFVKTGHHVGNWVKMVRFDIKPQMHPYLCAEGNVHPRQGGSWPARSGSAEGGTGRGPVCGISVTNQLPWRRQTMAGGGRGRRREECKVSKCP